MLEFCYIERGLFHWGIQWNVTLKRLNIYIFLPTYQTKKFFVKHSQCDKYTFYRHSLGNVRFTNSGSAFKLNKSDNRELKGRLPIFMQIKRKGFWNSVIVYFNCKKLDSERSSFFPQSNNARRAKK